MTHDYTAEEGARIYIEKILAILDIEGKVIPEDLDESTVCYRIECKTDDARMLIGRNGQTLEALQFVVRQMCRGTGAEHGPFIVDVLDYRARRRRNLEDQAKKAAVAVSNGDSERYALPPMSPYERRIVHQYLHEHFADLASDSEGEGQDRHIVISFKGMPDGESPDEDSDDEYYREPENSAE